MAVRRCPMCLAVVPAGKVVAFSNDLACPKCQRPLEIARPSRYLAITAGLVAGAFVWNFTRTDSGPLAWALPIVYGYLAVSAVAPLVLMATADLRLRALERAPDASASPATPAAHP